MRLQRRAQLAGAAAIALVLAACGDGGGASPTAGEAASVEIRTFAFRPPRLAVPAGTVVEWHNSDDILHTVTSGPRDAHDHRFDADLDGPGSTFSVTFDDPGTYEYVCSVHPGMDATVVVG